MGKERHVRHMRPKQKDAKVWRLTMAATPKRLQMIYATREISRQKIVSLGPRSIATRQRGGSLTKKARPNGVLGE